ncbi:hypothetical protein EV174_006486, partial [Coemansia sp. RSA 2320]
MSQALALARFRRSNFTALWKQLARLRGHCQRHFDDLIDRTYASALFSESSLETHYLFRISQLYNIIQIEQASCRGDVAGSATPARMLSFPALAVWRGW